MKAGVMVETLAGIFILLAIFGLVHQKVATSDGWFNWTQFWHHESLVVLCFGVATSLIVGKYAGAFKAVKRTLNRRLKK